MNNKQKMEALVDLINKHDDTNVKFADCKGCDLCKEIRAIGKASFGNDRYAVYKQGKCIKRIKNKREALEYIGLPRGDCYPIFTEVRYKDYTLFRHDEFEEKIYDVKDNYLEEYKKAIFDYYDRYGLDNKHSKVKKELNLFCSNQMMDNIKRDYKTPKNKRRSGSKVFNKNTGVTYISIREALEDNAEGWNYKRFAYHLEKGTFEHLEIIK